MIGKQNCECSCCHRRRAHLQLVKGNNPPLTWGFKLRYPSCRPCWKQLEMLFRPAELTHTSEKFEFTTKEFGARSTIRSPAAGTTSSVARRWPISSQQLECDWLAPYCWVRFTSNLLLYFMLFCDTHDLVWEIISISEKRMKNCIVKIINNVFVKMTKMGHFL